MKPRDDTVIFRPASVEEYAQHLKEGGTFHNDFCDIARACIYGNRTCDNCPVTSEDAMQFFNEAMAREYNPKVMTEAFNTWRLLGEP